MDVLNTEFYVGIIVLIIILLVLYLFSKNYEKRIFDVDRTSTKYAHAKELYNAMSIVPISGPTTIQIPRSSKKAVNSIASSMEKANIAIMSILLEDNSLLETIKARIQNYKQFIAFSNSVSALKPTSPEIIDSCNISQRFYEKEENRLISKLLEEAGIHDIHYLFHFFYTSPKGQNTYWVDIKKNCSELEDLIKEMVSIDKKRQLVQYERGILSRELRYDVLKRDNFHCVLCGRGPEDGVKLHVDHIKPVSKGGKTVLSNLRTCCEDCNLGKSDKFDPTGVN